jgi:hypothetical protein
MGMYALWVYTPAVTPVLCAQLIKCQLLFVFSHRLIFFYQCQYYVSRVHPFSIPASAFNPLLLIYLCLFLSTNKNILFPLATCFLVNHYCHMEVNSYAARDQEVHAYSLHQVEQCVAMALVDEDMVVVSP